MLKTFVRRVLKATGYEVMSAQQGSNYRSLKNKAEKYKKDSQELMRNLIELENIAAKSESQLLQEAFVLAELKYKKDGFFVEFGATNGKKLSNTYLLEKAYNWQGILSEPARIWHDELFRVRRAHIETRCVWKKTGEKLRFKIANDPEYSAIENFLELDDINRESIISEYVETISLEDLLEEGNAPKLIDYLSIDTEGSEYEILENFDFSKFTFRTITVEHNFTSSREKLYQLLTKNGYTRKYEGISRWDDWYVFTG